MLLNIMLVIFAGAMLVNAYIMWRNYVTMRMLIFQLNSFVEHQNMINDFLDQQGVPGIVPNKGE